MSCPIGKPFPDDALERFASAGGIVNAECDAIVMPEIELREVALKVRLGNVVIHASDTALHDRKIAFDGVGMGLTAHVFLNAMINGLMLEVLIDVTVLPGIVCHDGGIGMNLFAKDRAQIRAGHIGQVERANPAITLNEGEHGFLAPTPTKAGLGALAAVPVLFLTADIGFVRFDKLIRAPHRGRVAVTHCLTDAMPHEPCSFEGDTQGPVKLVSANALLAGRDEEDRLQPDMQLYMARLENGPDLDGEGLAARIALVEAGASALASQLAAIVHNATMGADATLRPNVRLYELVGGFFIVKVRRGKDGHGLFH